MEFNIALLRGDGIGPEIVDSAVEVLKKTGDDVKKGDVIAILHTNKKEKLPEAEKKYLSAISYGNSAKKDPEIYGIVR